MSLNKQYAMLQFSKSSNNIVLQDIVLIYLNIFIEFKRNNLKTWNFLDSLLCLVYQIVDCVYVRSSTVSDLILYFI